MRDPRELISLSETFSPRGMLAKLKNRRVIVHPSHDGKDWYIQFKILVDCKTREIRTTDLVLSDEALSALANLHHIMQKVC